MLRENLFEIQKSKGDNWIVLNDLPDGLKYIPEVYGASEEIHFRKVKGILYDYDIKSQSEIVNKLTGRRAVVRFKLCEKKNTLGKWEKFVKLAQPDENGFSERVSKSEFEAVGLTLGNGGDFCRDESTLDKIFVVERIANETSGNSIDYVKLNGYRVDIPFNQTIAKSIRDELVSENCVMLGCNGESKNTRIEIDHKDGRKQDLRVADPQKQTIDDFQPLCKAANDIKRQICKKCEENNLRWNAKNIKGNPYEFYEGDEHYTEELGCVGCYQYDPVAYRISSAKRLTQETLEYVMNKLYPEFKE